MEVMLGMLDDNRLFLLDYQVPMVVRMATLRILEEEKKKYCVELISS